MSDRRYENFIKELDREIVFMRRSDVGGKDGLSPLTRARIERLEREKEYLRGRLSLQHC